MVLCSQCTNQCVCIYTCHMALGGEVPTASEGTTTAAVVAVSQTPVAPSSSQSDTHHLQQQQSTHSVLHSVLC